MNLSILGEKIHNMNRKGFRNKTEIKINIIYFINPNTTKIDSPKHCNEQCTFAQFVLAD